MSDVAEVVVLPPDPGLAKSIGANHSLTTAMADLVDNSVDAGAGRVLIRFLVDQDRLVEIHVLDDGAGMDGPVIDRAMTLGAQRDYGSKALGHFGLGLKAAGLGTANTLAVYSQKRGATPVGRRLRRESMARAYECEVLTADASQEIETYRSAVAGGETGTVVRLTELRTRYAGQSDVDARTWLHDSMQKVRLHLGLVMHRLLADGRLRLETEEGDLGSTPGAPVPVAAVDPFGYRTSGSPKYPTALSTDVGGRTVSVQAHVWPARDTGPAFRLGGRDGRDSQGFYVYRGDRLLVAGSWLDVVPSSENRMLARVAVEFDDVEEHVTMNPEKSSLSFDVALHEALHDAASDGTTFTDYLTDAENVLTTARRRNRVRKPAVAVAKGFSPRLRRAIEDELEFDPGFDPVSIRWKTLPDGEFLDVDMAARTVWLNLRYRKLLIGDRAAGLNDAPLVKALVYLLTRDVFLGQYLGPRDRDNVALWKAVLGEAVIAEDRWWGETKA